MPQITYRKAINDALAEEIIRDENVVIIGEEVARYNAANSTPPTEPTTQTTASDE